MIALILALIAIGASSVAALIFDGLRRRDPRDY